jgi:phytoene synthase
VTVLPELDLAPSYDACRQLHASHGRSYYLATRLLPAATRPSVHALYGFARVADEVVDDLRSTLTVPEKAARLEELGAAVRAGDPAVPVAPAVHDTVVRHGIPWEHLDALLDAMRQDLTVSRYPTYDDLLGYMHGSAAVVGLALAHVFGTVVPLRLAAPYAADLGLAMQLTNFLRDVGEDLQRDRVYLPQEDLNRFGVTVDRLRAGVVDDRFRRLMRFEVDRTRRLYSSAAQGVRLLAPPARPAVEAALQLYAGILDEVERADFHVLDRRVRVAGGRRLVVAARVLATSSVRPWSPRS